MITPRSVSDSRCNGCHGLNRVIEYKLEAPHSDTAALIRLCCACRAELRGHLDQALKADDAELIARSEADNWNGLPWLRDTKRHPIKPEPNTENVRRRQAAGQPVSFLESIQARPRDLDETCKATGCRATGYNNVPCTCGDHRWRAWLESQSSFRVNGNKPPGKTRTTRKRASAIRKKGIGPKARKKP